MRVQVRRRAGVATCGRVPTARSGEADVQCGQVRAEGYNSTVVPVNGAMCVVQNTVPAVT